MNILTLEGLIAIAKAAGVIRYEYRVLQAKDERGLIVICILVLPTGEKQTKVTMQDAIDAGRGKTAIWIFHPEKMLRMFALELAIRSHFSEAVKSHEQEVSA